MQNLPKNFLEKLQKIYSKEELEIIKSGFLVNKRPTTFRVNTIKSSNKEIEDYLNEKNIKFEKISYLLNWYKLINWKEKDLWDLDIFNDWKIYLQWITSQFIWEVIRPSPLAPLLWSRWELKEVKVLDLTAAPGWKTSHISAILENNWEIIANELNAIRFEKLNFTIKRQGCQNVKCIKWDAKNLKNTFEENYFDIIIADLPCSAEWRVNLNNEKSYAFLEKEWINNKNYKIQKEILENTIWLLKTWWVLIYSTCTLDPRENEAIVHFLLSNYKDLKLESLDDIFEDENIKKYKKSWIKSFENLIFNNEVSKSVRLLPSQETEWFFIAKFRKV